MIQFDAEFRRVRPVPKILVASGEEVIRFVSRSERERARLIREARATYERIFPPGDPPSAQQGKVKSDCLATGTAGAGRGKGSSS